MEEQKVCRQVKAEQEPELEPLPELTREAILEAEDLPFKPVDVPEWGGRVYIRTLTGRERENFQDTCAKRVKGEYVDVRELKTRLLVCTLCDSNGVRLFQPTESGRLNLKSSAVIDRLFEESQRHNRLGADVGELAGN